MLYTFCIVLHLDYNIGSCILGNVMVMVVVVIVVVVIVVVVIVVVIFRE